MNDNRLDARMRALFAGIDTSTEFEARVLARIGTLHAGPDANLLVCAQRHREATRRRLRQQAWMNATTAIGIGAALIALVWQQGPAVTHWVQRGLATTSDSGALAAVTFAALGVSAWIALRRLLPAP